MVEGTEKKTDDKSVVEKRLKPTLIRRRATKTETPLPTAETEAAPVSSEEAPVVAAAPIEEKKTPPTTPVAPVRAAVPRIGLVGHINDLMPAAATTTVREDWREKQQIKAPKKKRTAQELEMDMIQRAGGLKQFAGSVQLDDVEEPRAELPAVPIIEERVFQPTSTGRKRKATRREFKKTSITETKVGKKVIRIDEGITVTNLSQATGRGIAEIIKRLMDLGMMATANQTIELDVASMLAEESGYKVEHTGFKEEDVLQSQVVAMAENLTSRPPVVTVMGHVDHGKTSLLDAIRKENVAEGEAGGITQHIGAYQVTVRLPGEPSSRAERGISSITFLDTPGHAAFTAMRARGAKVTDIVILVVAADDGIMPQTIEAINHAKAAEVPIVVAVNKIDKPGAQPDRVKQSLTEHGLVPEEWGGDVMCVPTSAKTKEGIDKLLEAILLQAELADLKADQTIRPLGVVVEARLDKGRGPVATVIVQEGTLRTGQYIVCGSQSGKVKAMNSAAGVALREALPATPVEVLGLSGVPNAGDEFVGVTDEKAARDLCERRTVRDRKAGLAGSARTSLEELQASTDAGDVKELRLVVKADVQGSVEAVADALEKLSTDTVKVRVLHRGVGGITESDVMLAAASRAVVIGFNVQPDSKAREAASGHNVESRTYRIIYEMLDEIKKAMAGLLAPREIERVLGKAEVRQVFRITKVGQIAGCSVVEGKIMRTARLRLLRDQVVIFEGKVESLKRFKDDAREVAQGYECGIGIENFNDVKVGDIIEAFIIEKVAAIL